MKKCPVCQQTYTDDDLNFCLNDGGTLQTVRDDPPPTIFMNKPRPTSENQWSGVNQTSPWETPANTNQPNAWTNPHQSQSPMFTPPMSPAGQQNQSMAIISLVSGISAVLLGICCYLGIPLGSVALVTGYLGMTKANENPLQYGGRTLAIIGMIAGGVGFLISAGMLLLVLITKVR